MIDFFGWKNGVVAIMGHVDGLPAPVGAGFIVSPDGLVITCHHVIEQSDWPFKQWDTTLQVRMQANNHYADGLVLEDYFRPDLELAILRLQGELPKAAAPLPIWKTNDANGHTT
ncbi:MAG: serine protease [Chloroflexota bacterium]|jgi:S1-C subfamily serine protease